MSLKQKLQDDLKASLKAGDSERRSVIGMAMAAIKNKEIEKRSELDDDEIIAVLGSEIKKRKDSVAQYEQGGRPELAEGERKEAAILSEYLPEQIPEEAVRDEVKKAISETGATSMKDMGKVIGAVMAKVKGRAGGDVVSAMVKEELSK